MLLKACARKHQGEEQCSGREALTLLLLEDHSLGVWVGDLSHGVNGKGSPCGLKEVSPSEGHEVHGKSIWGLYSTCYEMCRGGDQRQEKGVIKDGGSTMGKTDRKRAQEVAARTQYTCLAMPCVSSVPSVLSS